MPPLTLTRRAFTAGAAATAVATVAGCSGSEDSGSETPAEPDQVTYLTAFGASAHDAFIFMAQEKGYFKQAGIELNVQLGGGPPNLTALLADEAQFTYVDWTGLLIDIGQGTLNATDFQALSAIHQQTLVAIITPADSGIEGPGDLTGRKIGAFGGSPTESLLPAYAELAGFEYDQDNVLLSDVSGLFGMLAGGDADALSTFIIQKGVIESIIGKETRAFAFSDYLTDLLGTGLIATSRLAGENPDLCTRFRDAAMRGVRDMLDDPEGAIETMAAANPAIDVSVPAYVAQIEVMTPYITSQGDDRIGVMDEAHVVRCISVLQSAGLIEAGLTPEAILGDLTLLTDQT